MLCFCPVVNCRHPLPSRGPAAHGSCVAGGITHEQSPLNGRRSPVALPLPAQAEHGNEGSGGESGRCLERAHVRSPAEQGNGLTLLEGRRQQRFPEFVATPTVSVNVVAIVAAATDGMRGSG